MDRQEIIKILKLHRKDIEKFGAKIVGIFGSFARDEGSERSDVDIVVEFERGKGTFKNFGGLVEYLENLLNRPVDILTPAGIENIRIKEVKENIKQEILYV